MFTGDIIPFQSKHEESLLRKCADHYEVILYAPTGSGKTVLVSRFIDDYLDENPNTVFLWLCPGAGGLERQSQDTFEAVTSGIPDGDVYSFINEPVPRGRERADPQGGLRQVRGNFVRVRQRGEHEGEVFRRRRDVVRHPDDPRRGNVHDLRHGRHRHPRRRARL